jgi:SAM-dependent methyltransferase
VLHPHSNAWYDNLSKSQYSYYYPWHSDLPPNHGEDNYIALLKAELRTNDTVLDAGCGSGELTNQLAPYCRFIYGYDRVARFIKTAQSCSPSNASFILHDSKKNGIPKLPLEGKCIDWFISSKGPAHWIVDALRIANQNARFVMLMPFFDILPEWNNLLPDDLQIQGVHRQDLVDGIQRRLETIGLLISHLQFFTCDEVFQIKWNS